VLTRLLDGKRAADIAADLVVSQSTVRNHLSSIYAKLRVNGQVDLIRTLRRDAATSLRTRSVNGQWVGQPRVRARPAPGMRHIQPGQ
jgi:DNA-binding transcriptional ArsR family regulator